MPGFLDNLVDQMMLWPIRTSKGCRYDGIGLVSFRREADSFYDVMQSSLRLIQERDARRYARVKKHISWIVNQVNNSLGAEYYPNIRACFLQFEDAPELERDVFIACSACVLIHEATHGLIESRGIKMTNNYRVRIERLCCTEQNRFAAKLSTYDSERYPPVLLQFHFDERYWTSEWEKKGGERGVSFIKRWITDRKTG